MKEIRGLSFEENKKYQSAIKKGYFNTYEADPRKWKHTFSGTFVWKHPERVATLEAFRKMLGYIPEWEDLTDTNLRDLREALSYMYCANTHRNRLAEIKAIINEYIDEKPIPSKKYEKILVAKSEASDSVYLNDTEIGRIILYDPRDKIEQYVRKVFVIEALTGARRCDSDHLSLENCNSETDELTYFSQKVRKSVTLPVHESVKPFLADPISLDLQRATFNNVLRRICHECNINERVALFRRGENVAGEKWNFVSSHTGRRSFATNLFRSGVDPYTISQFMGHTSPDITIQRYIIGLREADEKTRIYFKTPLV